MKLKVFNLNDTYEVLISEIQDWLNTNPEFKIRNINFVPVDTNYSAVILYEM